MEPIQNDEYRFCWSQSLASVCSESNQSESSSYVGLNNAEKKTGAKPRNYSDAVRHGTNVANHRRGKNNVSGGKNEKSGGIEKKSLKGKQNSKKKEHLEENVYISKNKSPQSHENQTDFQKNKFRRVDFHYLQELCLLEVSESMLVFLNPKSGFLNLFEKKDLRPDWIILIMEILSKVCLSDLNYLKGSVLSPACSYTFIENLRSYISSVPMDKDKKRQSNTLSFFHNTFIFCDTVNDIIPLTAKERLQNIFQTVDIVLKFIRENKSKTECHFLQDDSLVEIIKSFSQLHSRTLSVVGKNTNKQNVNEDATDILEECPPSDFQSINILPTYDDIFSTKPFLRKNIVKGSYSDVLNYLDIQFRLFREDFIAPLRDGIREYLDRLTNPGKKIRMKSVKTYVNVSFENMVSHQNGFGFEVHFSVENRRNINWEQSKQLMCGSLLLISNDEFNTFFPVTVLDRKIELLQKGIITVALPYGAEIPENIFENHYVMLESVVYFEPYFRVLTALKKVKEENFPMEKYIISVEAKTAAPKYLKDKEIINECWDSSDLLNSQLKNHLGSIENLIDINSSEESEVAKNDCPPFQWTINSFVVSNILNEECWPSYSDLKLDPSQYSAFKAALTSEFCVIQGPPGTGKTFIALKIAEVLLKNVHFQSSPIMVICYTNHALDQFLEGILSFTDRLIRIGGQSKNTNLDKYNIKEVRRTISNRYSYSRNIRYQLEEIYVKIKGLEEKYKSLNFYGILKLGILKNFMAAKEQKKLAGGILAEWLLEDILMGESIYYSCNDNSDDLLQIPQSQMKENEEEEEEMLVAENILDVEKDWDLDEENTLRQQETEIDPLNIQFRINLKRNTSCESQFLDFEFSSNIKYIDYNLEWLNEAYELCVKKKHSRRKLHFLQNEIKSFENSKLKEIDKMNVVKSYLDEKLSTEPPFDQDILKEFTESDNIWSLDTSKRWALYHYWKTLYAKVIMNDIKVLLKEHSDNCFMLEEYRQIEDIDFVKKAKVIGMTTTSSARLHSMLERLKPKIVIVEEAAEVFEAHIVTALTKHCEHVILIGDHKQLRPNPNTYKLAKDYHLDISLFERMLKNGMSCHTLGVQHRMRPEFASLLVPTIYPELENHSSVEGRADIRGVGSNLYFINHIVPEDQVADSSSRSNKHEADFLISLCCYLIYQGYKPGEITILSPYIGQMYYLFKRRREKPMMRDVRITVIDNFQGEENKIILLSLVRSNADARIGFLGTDNRICVSLSRAKDGFYIIGNMDNLTQNSTTWKEINRRLDELNAIGPALPLRCENHKHHITRVSCQTDFRQVLHGCCPLNCDAIMDCGHACTKICHLNDREHKENKCLEYCIRENCEFAEHNYKCKKLCWEICNLCKIIVKRKLSCSHEIDLPCHQNIQDFKCEKVVKTLLVCGHDYEMYCHDYEIYRYEDPPPTIKCKELTERILKCGHVKSLKCYFDATKYKCKESVDRELPCGHSGIMDCCQDARQFECKAIVKYTIPLCKHEVDKLCYLKEVEICPHPCIDRLDCGHVCSSNCHKNKDPDHLKYKCTKECAVQKKKNCSMNHKCEKLCHYNQDCDECILEVVKELPCGHETNVLCCVDVNNMFCSVPCVKTLQCSHTVDVQCSTDVGTWECLERCVKMLPCGHETNVLCWVDVNKVFCRVPCVKTLPCSHTVNVQCSTDVGTWNCQELCEKTLPCGHETNVLCWVDVNKVFCSVPCVKTLKCSHTVNVKCCSDVDTLKCQEICEKTLPCGHHVVLECSADVLDQICKEIVEKKPPTCDHTQQLQCYQNPNPCKEACLKLLDCGHRCFKQCWEDCSSEDCQEIVNRHNVLTDCGHNNIALSCSIFKKYSQDDSSLLQKTKSFSTINLESWITETKVTSYCLQRFCQELCNKKLPCGHTCSGLCGDCIQGNIHVPCTEKCNNKLICGHTCVALCKEICPPCNQKCLNCCQHRQCSRLCGETCEPCMEKCDWKCAHKSCTRLCSQMCNRDPCYVPCPKELKCGHPCMGFCGEVCPACCPICDGLYEQHQRLVQLEDCGHVVDSKKLDMLICKTLEDGQISLKVCPTCTTPINKTKRYRNTTRVTNRKIQAVKSQVLYEFRGMFTKIDFLKSKLLSNRHHEIFKDLVDLVDVMLKESNPTESPHNYYAVVMISEWLIELSYQRFIGSRVESTSDTKIKKLIESRAESLSKSMKIYLKSMNVEVMNRFDLEVLRFKRMKSLTQPINQEAFNLLFSSKDYSVEMDEEICTKLKVLGKCLKSVPSSNKNVNLSENIWFQCLNDHLYCETRSSGRICTRCSNKQKKEENARTSIDNLEKELYQQLRSTPRYRKYTRPAHRRSSVSGQQGYSAPEHRGSFMSGHSVSGQQGYSAPAHYRSFVSGQQGFSAPEHRGSSVSENSVSGQQGYSAPEHRGSSVSGHSVSGQQGYSAPAHRGSSVSGQQGYSIPEHRGSSVSGRSVSGQQGYSAPEHRGSSVSGHSVSGQQGYSTPLNRLHAMTRHSLSGHEGYSASGNGVYRAPGLRRNSASEHERTQRRGNSTPEHGRNSVPQHSRNISSENIRSSVGRGNSIPGHGENSVPRHRNKRQEDKHPADCDLQQIPSLLHMKLEKPPSQQTDSSSSKLKVSVNHHNSYKKKEKRKRKEK